MATEKEVGVLTFLYEVFMEEEAKVDVRKVENYFKENTY